MEMSKRLTIRGRNAKHTTHPLIVVALIVLGFVVGRLSITTSWAASGTLDSPAPPGSTFSYTLEDIYNRLNDRTWVAPSAFAEPDSGPTAGTGHTLDELYDLIGERAPVPKTGQVECYNEGGDVISCTETGQDGEHQRGVSWPSPRFITSTMGIVTDTLTGLIWLADANCTSFFSGDSTGQNDRSWSDALVAANALASGRCGLSDGSSPGDWRLPNVREMQSLVDHSRHSPALPSGQPFAGVQLYYYWSSTTYEVTTSRAWQVNLGNGIVAFDFKSASFYVWPVRGGE